LRAHPNVFDGPLPTHFDVLSHDQRGLGQTDKPDADYEMADYAEDAAALLDAVGWDSCLVMGVSFGGMVAQELTIRHPHRVQRLVLACSSSGGAGGSSYPIQELYDMPVAEGNACALEVTDSRRDPAWQAAHPAEVEAALKPRQAGIDRRAAEPGAEKAFRRQLAARWAHDTYDRLPQLRMPVFIAGGRYDGQAAPANQEAIHQQIPRSQLEFFEGGHQFLQQDAAAYPRIIEWLKEQPA
jgi:3-oxoadipate enol-lactonase